MSNSFPVEPRAIRPAKGRDTLDRFASEADPQDGIFVHSPQPAVPVWQKWNDEAVLRSASKSDGRVGTAFPTFDVTVPFTLAKAFARRPWLARGAVSVAVIALVAVFLPARNGTAPAPQSSTSAPGETATETADRATDMGKTMRELTLPSTLSSFGSAGKTDALVSALSTMADDPLVPAGAAVQPTRTPQRAAPRGATASRPGR